MMEKALFVGGTGFVGRHAAQIFCERYEVVATGRSRDIRDAAQVRTLVKDVCPSVVVNLASLTTVKETFDDPINTYRTGFLGMLNLLTALKESGFSGRVLNISSSEVYGFPSEDLLPLKETAPVAPMSPYSVNKIATEALCYQWAKSEEFEILTARPFTHIGPGQSDRFSISHFARQLAQVRLGRKEPVLKVGNLDATRDLTDVRDVVDAYRLLLEFGQSGEVYNVCSGAEVNMRQVLNELVCIAGVDVQIEQTSVLTRKQEQRRIRGSFEKLANETGWCAKIPLRKTLSDMLEYWLRAEAVEAPTAPCP